MLLYLFFNTVSLFSPQSPASIASKHCTGGAQARFPTCCRDFHPSCCLPTCQAGDVNLFFTIEDEGRAAAEIEVMVAEPGSRGKGLAKEALRLLMAYACK